MTATATPALFRAFVARRIDATPEEVFDAWAEPDRFARWFETRRAILRRAAVDELWFWEAEHLEKLWAHYCRYTRVERPRLLEFTWVSEATHGRESLVTIELAPADGGTELTLTHTGIPDDELGRGHQQGWAGIVEVLAKKIADLGGGEAAG
jgi:uncharacterized protein YndB with AHSA1/START domain